MNGFAIELATGPREHFLAHLVDELIYRKELYARANKATTMLTSIVFVLIYFFYFLLSAEIAAAQMKFTLSWLKEHLETQASLAEICETLTRIGLEVERVDNPAEKLSGFVVARVLEAKQHPNADRLRVCMVDAGSGAPVQVVCGAPNARTGMISVFSPPGTYIPGKNAYTDDWRDPRRRVRRHVVLGRGTRNLRRS